MIDNGWSWNYILQPVGHRIRYPLGSRATNPPDAFMKSYLSTQEVSELLSINEKLVYSLISEKGLPATKITGKWLFPRHLLDKWFTAQIPSSPHAEIGQYAARGILTLAGGDDPLLQDTLFLFHLKRRGTIFLAGQGSIGGFASLKRGLCHISSRHLLRQDDGEYDDASADDLPEAQPVIVNFCQRQHGLAVQKGNPKNIRSIADLAQKGVTIVNRSLGSGTRLLFDYEIARSEVSANAIRGYLHEFPGYMDACLEVLSGRADAAPAIRAAADLAGLDFLPMRWERHDFLIAREFFFDPSLQGLINLLHEPAFKNLAARYPGYDLALSGKIFPYKRQARQ